MLKSWHIICSIVGIRNYFTGEGQALCEIRKVVIQKRVDDHNQTNKRGIAIMNFGILVLLIAIILFALLAFKQFRYSDHGRLAGYVHAGGSRLRF